MLATLLLVVGVSLTPSTAPDSDDVHVHTLRAVADPHARAALAASLARMEHFEARLGDLQAENGVLQARVRALEEGQDTDTPPRHSTAGPPPCAQGEGARAGAPCPSIEVGATNATATDGQGEYMYTNATNAEDNDSIPNRRRALQEADSRGSSLVHIHKRTVTTRRAGADTHESDRWHGHGGGGRHLQSSASKETCTVATLRTRTNAVNNDCCNEITEDCSSGGAVHRAVC